MSGTGRAREPAIGASPDATLALARAAAEAVRSLNHATLGGTGLAQPADVYGVLGELAYAASGLPQLLVQMGGWLDAALAAGRLGCDDGTDPVIAVSAAGAHMTGARAAAAALASDLGQAQQQLAAVHGTPQEETDGLGTRIADCPADDAPENLPLAPGGADWDQRHEVGGKCGQQLPPSSLGDGERQQP